VSASLPSIPVIPLPASDVVETIKSGPKYEFKFESLALKSDSKFES